MTDISLFKVVGVDGRAFDDQTLWIASGDAIQPGGVVQHPDPDGVLTVVDRPGDSAGMEWPCRVLAVEAVPGVEVWHVGGRMQTKEPERQSNYYGARAWRVVDELPGHVALGPYGTRVLRILDRALALTDDEVERLVVAHDEVEHARQMGSPRRWSTRENLVNSYRLVARQLHREPALLGVQRAACAPLVERAERDPSLDLTGAHRLVGEALLAAIVIGGQHDHYALLMEPWWDAVGLS